MARQVGIAFQDCRPFFGVVIFQFGRRRAAEAGLANDRRLRYHRAMASPARKPSTGTGQRDETLDILRRLEPVLSRLTEDVGEIKDDVKKLDDRLRKVETDVARIDGRLTGIEGQLRQIPTLWQLAGLIFAIFGASFVLIRFASGH